MPAASVLMRIAPAPVTTRSISSVKRRIKLALRRHHHRHAAHDAVGVRVESSAGRVRRQPVQAPGCCARRREIDDIGPRVRPHHRKADRRRQVRWRRYRHVMARTRPGRRANGAWLRPARRRCSAVCAAARGCPRRDCWKLSAASAGDMRSGSAKMMSKAITALPSLVSLLTSSATSVRGHGHCP